MVAITLTLAAAGALVMRQNIHALEETRQESLVWSTMQVELELQRFLRALEGFLASTRGGEAADPAPVNQRFDILWSRVNVVRQGNVGRRVGIYDAESHTIPAFVATLEAADPLIVGLSPGDAATAERLAAMFAPHEDALRDLSRGVLHGEARAAANLRKGLSRSSQMLFFLSGASVLIALALLAVFWRESLRYRRIASQNARLLKEARNLDRARSRFMTMMSHELRTPMNGVLGLMSLLSQTRLTERQAELVAEANRSGERMNDLLRELMDFSELDASLATRRERPFLLSDLQAALQDVWHQTDEGPELRVRLEAAADLALVGDVNRTVHAFLAIIGDMRDLPGIDWIAVAIGHEDDMLRIDIAPGSRAGGAVPWQPELLAGKGNRGRNYFASDAIGPSIGRQIISRMGGSVRVMSGGGRGSGKLSDVLPDPEQTIAARLPATARAQSPDAVPARAAAGAPAAALVANASALKPKGAPPDHQAAGPRPDSPRDPAPESAPATAAPSAVAPRTGSKDARFLRLRVPAARFRRARPKIWLNMASGAALTLCRTALASLPLAEWSEGDAGSPDFVLWDAAAMADADTIRAFAALHPESTLIGVNCEWDRVPFDLVLRLPEDTDRLIARLGAFCRRPGNRKETA